MTGGLVTGAWENDACAAWDAFGGWDGSEAKDRGETEGVANAEIGGVGGKLGLRPRLRVFRATEAEVERVGLRPDRTPRLGVLGVGEAEGWWAEGWRQAPCVEGVGGCSVAGREFLANCGKCSKGQRRADNQGIRADQRDARSAE